MRILTAALVASVALRSPSRAADNEGKGGIVGALCGRQPYVGDRGAVFRQVVNAEPPDLPPSLYNHPLALVLRQGMAKDREARPQTAAERRGDWQARGHVLAQGVDESATRARRQLEHLQRADMHRHLGRLEVQEGGVEACQALHTAHARRAPCPTDR